MNQAGTWGNLPMPLQGQQLAVCAVHTYGPPAKIPEDIDTQTHIYMYTAMAVPKAGL